MGTWDTLTSLAADRQLMSAYDHAAILFMAEDRRPLADIAGAVGRSLGTVKSAIWRLRRDGVIPRRRAVV